MKRVLSFDRRSRAGVNAALLSAVALLVAGGLALVVQPITAQSTPAVEIRTLSARPGAISGGDVLVDIKVPSDVPTANVSVLLDGRDVKSMFRAGPAPTGLLGVVTGLQLGKNQLEVRVQGEPRAQLTLVNHPISGPVISGPQQTPFICATEASGLGPPLDANCSVNTRVQYFYRSNAPTTANAAADADAGNAATGFKPFDPAAPRPADLAMTTTTEGETVPFIVRRERGTINRAMYVIAFLHEPGQPLPTPWTTTRGWNGRLIYSFGGGCGAGYHQGSAAEGLGASQVGDYALAKGYAAAAASLNVYGTSCSDLISAETMMMVKERFIEQFGVPRYTIGSGRSGGSMQQHTIANNYPGLLDGIIPTASFADAMTFMGPLRDCELLDHALTTSTLTWTTEQKRAVSGTNPYDYCSNNGPRYPNFRAATNFDPKIIPAAQVYNPKTNLKGARFTFQDNLVNVFGRDPKTGFARRPFDNVGVQYGLGAFNDWKISFEQFLDLNKRIGGHDIDGSIVAERTAADPEAVRIAHQTGRLNDASRGLSAVPIIDARPYTDQTSNVHDGIHSYITRARLIAANGHADNQVLHTYAPGTDIQMVQRDNLDAMDQWLSNIARDTAPARTALEKIVRNKPSGLVDACYTAAGQQITDPATCRQLFPVASHPRLVAGMPLTSDRLKCELKPVSRGDYKQPVTDAQLNGLKAVFPQGVCDYSRPGIGQNAPDTWLSYPQPGTSTRLDDSSSTANGKTN